MSLLFKLCMIGFIAISIMIDISCSREPTASPTPSSLPQATSKIAHAFILDGNFELCVMGPDGSNFRNLTNNPAWDWEPTWSLDGSHIAFSSDRDGNWEIYVINADGSNQIRLTDKPGVPRKPAWSPRVSRH